MDKLNKGRESNKQLIDMAIKKAIDEAIGKLPEIDKRRFSRFRTKARATKLQRT